jgi:hypothetical protein
LCVVVILIWIVSTLSSLPIMEATVFKKERHNTFGKQVDICYTSIVEKWQIVYLFVMLFFFYVLPCKVLFILYGKIVFKIKNRNKKNSFIKSSISNQNNNENDIFNNMYKQSSIPRIRLFSSKEEKVKYNIGDFNWQKKKSKELSGDESNELDMKLTHANKKCARSPKVNTYNSSLKYRIGKFKFSSDSLKRSSSYNDLNHKSYSITSLQNGLRSLKMKNITMSSQFSAKKCNNKNEDCSKNKYLIESDSNNNIKINKYNAAPSAIANKNYQSYEGLKFSFSSVNKSRESIEGKPKSKSKSKSTSTTNTNLLITPQSRQSSQPKQSGTKHLPQINQKPIVILLIIMMLLIMIALLPYRIFSLWVALASKEKVRSLGLVKFFSLLTYCRVAYYSNSALNPIFYHIISTKFQNAFKKFFKLSYAPSILSNQSGTFRKARRFSNFKAG